MIKEEPAFMELFGILYQILFTLLGALVCSVCSSIFLGLCVYYDARFRADSSAALWGVLSGFFWIAALVYVIVQLCTKNKPLVCVRCRALLARESLSCPYCGMPVLVGGLPMTPALREQCRRRRKIFLILYIVFTLAAIPAMVMMIAGYIRLFSWAAGGGMYPV